MNYWSKQWSSNTQITKGLIPIEVRELVIKTTVDSGTNAGKNGELNEESMRKLRKGILKECKNLIQEEVKKNSDR